MQDVDLKNPDAKIDVAEEGAGTRRGRLSTRMSRRSSDELSCGEDKIDSSRRRRHSGSEDGDPQPSKKARWLDSDDERGVSGSRGRSARDDKGEFYSSRREYSRDSSRRDDGGDQRESRRDGDSREYYSSSSRNGDHYYRGDRDNYHHPSRRDGDGVGSRGGEKRGSWRESERDSSSSGWRRRGESRENSPPPTYSRGAGISKGRDGGRGRDYYHRSRLSARGSSSSIRDVDESDYYDRRSKSREGRGGPRDDSRRGEQVGSDYSEDERSEKRQKRRHLARDGSPLPAREDKTPPVAEDRQSDGIKALGATGSSCESGSGGGVVGRAGCSEETARAVGVRDYEACGVSSHSGGSPGAYDGDVNSQRGEMSGVDAARRDDLTVLVVNLSLKANERDVWKFFSANAGTVRDIQLIRDQRSGKSKGIGYVEFTSADSVLKALNLTGQLLLGQPVRVRASQAEKNRAAKAAKQLGPSRLYVGGLVDHLANLVEDDVRQLFTPFGTVLSVDIPRDLYTNRSRGFAFVQLKNAQEAREAMVAMNGFEIAGKTIKVGFYQGGDEDAILKGGGGGSLLQTASTTTPEQSGQTSSGPAGSMEQAIASLLTFGHPNQDLDRVADDDDRLLHGGALTRLALSQKLQQRSSDPIPLVGPAAHLLNPTIPSTAENSVKRAIKLENMYTRQEVEKDGLEILDEVQEDVRSECAKYGQIIQVKIDQKNIDGSVYILYATPEQANEGQKKLNGRFFGGSAITASVISVEKFDLVN